MQAKNRKIMLWILVAAVLSFLTVQFFKQGSEIKTLRVKERNLTVKIQKQSNVIEQLADDTLQYSNDNNRLVSENATLSKQNVLIKSAYKKRDEQAIADESKLSAALRTIEELKRERGAVREQLSDLQNKADDNSNKNKQDSVKIVSLTDTIDSLTNKQAEAEIPKKCLEELRHRFAPRILCLVGGLFQESCERIAKKISVYVPLLSEEETKIVYSSSSQGRHLRKIASENSVSPELLFLVSKSMGFNPPESICAEQAKLILKSAIENGDFETWCLSLFDISPDDVAVAKATILAVHKNFE